MNMQLYRRFDTPVSREGTECIKWDGRENFQNAAALPMWVADMDFQTADGIVNALHARVNHAIFGYPKADPRDRAAVVNWMARRHAVSISPESILFSPGVVDSIYHVLTALLPKGARVVIQPPVYGPFRGMTEKARMQAIENPLKETENGFEMDFNGLEDAFKAGADAFVLCSPHNPVGRVWRMEELQTLVNLCNRYHVRLISDEIHADFELRGARHIPILAVEGAKDAIMLVSATKTFNLAALRHSTIICENKEDREKIQTSMSEAMTDVNLFGMLATRAAYETGDEWLDTLNEYLSDGRELLLRGIARINGLRAARPQGTYLLWVNASALRMTDQALNRFFIDKCDIIPTEGAFFGSQGAGHVRLNFATTHKNLQIALERMEKAVKAL